MKTIWCEVCQRYVNKGKRPCNGTNSAQMEMFPAKEAAEKSKIRLFKYEIIPDRVLGKVDGSKAKVVECFL